jgi:hypothetical protein
LRHVRENRALALRLLFPDEDAAAGMTEVAG